MATYDSIDGKASRLASFVTDHIVTQLDGMEESLEFWTSRSNEHSEYFRGRRDVLYSIRLTIGRGIAEFFSESDIRAALDAVCEDSVNQE